MKNLILAGSLIGSVLASGHNHHHEMHQRRYAALSSGTPSNNSCAVVTTYTTYYYGEPTLVQDAPKPTTTSCSSSSSSSSSSTTPAPEPSTSEAAASSAAFYPVASVASVVESVVNAAGYGAAASSAAPAAAAQSSTSYSTVKTSGNKWAITYTPYTSSGGCKSADQVSSDLKSIAQKGFSAVRTYSTDCSGLQNIGAAAEANGLQIILGVYISSSGCSGAQSQVSDIISWGKFNLVPIIVVGNEAIFNKFTTAGELASFISSAKAKFKAAGFTGQVTTTETVAVLQEVGSQLCSSMDAVSANIHAYFNSGTSADEAGTFVAGQLDIISAICPGLPSYNLESGWPSSGNSNGKAVPGKSQQKIALDSIIEKAGSKSVLFSFDNDYWKAAGSYGVEQFFGCLDNL